MNLHDFVALCAVAIGAVGLGCSSTSSKAAVSNDGGPITGNGDNTHGGSGCVIYEDAGIPAECLIARINGVSSFGSQADCPAGSTYVSSCPTAMLYGCCSRPGATGGNVTNEEEDCAYDALDSDGGNLLENQAGCAMNGITGVPGVWSTTP